MQNKQGIYNPEKIFILRPSAIIDVEGSFFDKIIPGTNQKTEFVRQEVTFETVPHQVITYQRHHEQHPPFYYNIQIDNNGLIDCNNMNDCYFDQHYIEEIGLTTDNKATQFVGIFPFDIISLKDYYFIKKLGDLNLLKKIVYFHHLLTEDIALKKYYHNSFKLPTEISLDELRKLKLELEQVELPIKKDKKTYNYLKEKRTKSYKNKTVIPSREAYLGTEEEETFAKELEQERLREQFV